MTFGEFAMHANENTFIIAYEGSDTKDTYNFLTFAIITENGSISW